MRRTAPGTAVCGIRYVTTRGCAAGSSPGAGCGFTRSTGVRCDNSDPSPAVSSSHDDASDNDCADSPHHCTHRREQGDLQHREGRPYPVTLPLIPGTEAAGTVVAVGSGADTGLVGAPVVHFGHLAGVYAELTAVPLEFVVPLAPHTPLDIAAAVAMNGTTAYVLTSEAQRVGPGDVVVVHAAAGATGGAVVQRAAAAGAEVIAVASTAGKAAVATAL